MRRICVFGDLHGKNLNVPRADAYFLTGDISGLPDEEEIRKKFFKAMNSPEHERIKFLKGASEQKNINRFIMSAYVFLKRVSATGKPVYFVSGNREIIFKLLVTQLNPHLKTLEQRIKNIKNIKCIDGQVVDFFGMRLLGIPFVPSTEWYLEHYSSIPGFKSKFEQLKLLHKQIEDIKADIVLSHCPPFGILDEHPKFGHLGVKSVRRYIDKNKPRYVFCGHIHEATGVQVYDNAFVANMGTSYYVFEIQ